MKHDANDAGGAHWVNQKQEYCIRIHSYIRQSWYIILSDTSLQYAALEYTPSGDIESVRVLFGFKKAGGLREVLHQKIKVKFGFQFGAGGVCSERSKKKKLKKKKD